MKALRKLLTACVAASLALAASLSLVDGARAQPAAADVDRTAAATPFWNYAEIDAGAFCITRIPDGAVTRVSRPARGPYGEVRVIDIEFKTGNPKARILFLDGARRLSGPYKSCSSFAGPGVTPILEANILHGKVRMTVPTSVIGDRAYWLQIDHEELSLNIEPTRNGFKSLYGGTIQPGKELRIVSIGDVRFDLGLRNDATDDVLQGTVRFGSRRLSIQNMRMLLAPGAQPSLVSAAATDAGASLDLQLSDARVSLHDGELVSQAVTMPTGPTVVAGLSASLTSGSAKRTVIQGDKGLVTWRIEEATLQAPQWEQASPRVVSLPTAAVTVRTLSGAVPYSASEALLVDHNAADVKFPAGVLALGGTADSAAITGNGTARFAALTPTQVDGVFEVTTPNLPNLDSLGEPVRAKAITLKVSDARDAPMLSGALLPISGRIASASLSKLEKADILFGPSQLGSEFAIPLRIEAPAASGDWSFTDPSGTEVYLQGKLAALRLRGSLWVGNTDTTPRLEVSPGGLNLGASASVQVINPLLFGGAPADTKVGAGFSIVSPTGFEFGRNTRHGAVDIAASFFEITKPVLVFETGGSNGFEIQVPARLEADAAIRFGLADNAVSLASGRLHIATARATAVGETPVDIGGIAVTGAALGFDALTVTAKDGVANAEITGLSIDANRVAHAKTPQWTAEGIQPRFPRITAMVGQVNDALQVHELAVYDLSFKADRGSFVSPDGFTVAGNAFSLTARELTTASIDTAELRIGSGSVNLDIARDHQRTTGSTHFNTFWVKAHGSKDDVQGSGRIVLDDFNVEHRFGLIPEHCNDDLPLIASVDLNRVDLDVAWSAGRLAGRVNVDSPAVGVKEDRAGSSCRWKQDFEVEVEKVVRTWACLSSGILGCIFSDWVSKKVKVHIDVEVPFIARLIRFRAGGVADSATVSLAGDDIGFCLHDVSLTPESGLGQVFSVAPDLGGFGGDVFRELTRPTQLATEAAFGLAQSHVTTSILRPLAIFTQFTNIKLCS